MALGFDDEVQMVVEDRVVGEAKAEAITAFCEGVA